MSKTNIYLKIYYTEPDALPMKVIAVVEESQFYSLENSFISILNYSDKIINKYNVTKNCFISKKPSNLNLFLK